MKVLLSSLLLSSLCALSSWSVSLGTFVVIQSPDVSVMEGQTVDITCCWTEKFERVRVNWLKNETEIKNEIFQKKSQGSLKSATNCSILNFPNIRRNESGRYICRVFMDIPYYASTKGNGTLITVMDLESSDYADKGKSSDSANSQLPVIIAVAVVVPLFLITIACFCNLRRKRVQALRVIYEVPHIDSEEAEPDKHSTSSSRGSSQWCQVPVYESVEYFQHVETKESE
ncbi:uncharacterized protein LOC103366239 isoform X2 [Stegastes partitus]|uniref:Uncharacterized protein LOC103366239 isoform X2 n=1 Tax=Stegastes partitus TaxID=144197 RepID=A0A9Y4KEC6_9TELE|nr:PREDICTED: uncharacterized protein LOC103366239 isoform X2 [Stegastes partitus]